MTDFGADVSFKRACERLQEHYGITVPNSAERRVTEGHAKRMRELQCLQTEIPEQGAVDRIIAETDGTLIPIVIMDSDSQEQPCTDKRKSRKVTWREGRLTLARQEGSVTPIFGATMGEPDQAGDHWLDCAIRAGFNLRSEVHCLGDGAPWIADQASRVFGTCASFLVDFYHVCEYLGAAAQQCAPENTDHWLHEQKENLKTNKVSRVLEALQPHLEPANKPDEKAPARKCHRYLTNRLDQIDYQSAIKAGLPIGSGEIESAHRHVIQQRLKISGAWWLPENADNMLTLRTTRANDAWRNYWQQHTQKAA
jgi:hypothetical protein